MTTFYVIIHSCSELTSLTRRFTPVLIILCSHQFHLNDPDCHSSETITDYLPGRDQEGSAKARHNVYRPGHRAGRRKEKPARQKTNDQYGRGLIPPARHRLNAGGPARRLQSAPGIPAGILRRHRNTPGHTALPPPRADRC